MKRKNLREYNFNQNFTW